MYIAHTYIHTYAHPHTHICTHTYTRMHYIFSPLNFTSQVEEKERKVHELEHQLAVARALIPSSLVRVCVCIYIRMYICMYAYLHAYVYMYVCIYAYMYTCIHVYLYTYMCVSMNFHINKPTHTFSYKQPLFTETTLMVQCRV